MFRPEFGGRLAHGNRGGVITAQRFAVAAIIGTLTAFALTGCGPAPWEDPADTPAPTVTTPPPPVPNDLSGGATQRDLTAGAVSMAVDYWSTLAMELWTASALKPLSVSMTATVEPADGQKVYVQRASMIAVPATASGDLAPLPAQEDAARVSPGYLMLSPYSYSQTFQVGAVPEEATHLTLLLSYDILVQSTPTSDEYAKHTVTDTVTVALSP